MVKWGEGGKSREERELGLILVILGKRPKTALSIEVRQMRRLIGRPGFRFPCDIQDMARHAGAVGEGRDIDQVPRGVRE